MNMLNSNVPFYPNTLDDTHCYQAALRIVLKYFLPKKEYSLKALDKMTDKKEGLWTWPMRGLINLKKMGFEVVIMEVFDYKSFSENGEKYLLDRLGEKVGRIQISYTDINQEQRNAKDFVKVFGNQTKLPELKDIRKLLKAGFLVICHVNSQKLNNKSGYAGHVVVVIGSDGNNLLIHDPGLPGKPNWQVPINRFISAWADPSIMEKSLYAIRLTG